MVWGGGRPRDRTAVSSVACLLMNDQGPILFSVISLAEPYAYPDPNPNPERGPPPACTMWLRGPIPASSASLAPKLGKRCCRFFHGFETARDCELGIFLELSSNDWEFVSSTNFKVGRLYCSPTMHIPGDEAGLRAWKVPGIELRLGACVIQHEGDCVLRHQPCMSAYVLNP